MNSISLEQNIREINSELDHVMGPVISDDDNVNFSFHDSTIRTDVHISMSSTCEYDIRVINDELEGLMGKFEPDSANAEIPAENGYVTGGDYASEGPGEEPVSFSVPQPVPDLVHVPGSDSARMALVVYAGSEESVEHRLDAAMPLRELRMSSDGLGGLVSELAAGRADGVVLVLGEGEEGGGCSPEVLNVLQIYSRLSPVVLVDTQATDRSGSDAARDSGGHMEWAQFRVTGFSAQAGVAAALLGLREHFLFSGG